MPGLDNNPAKDGKLFSDTHPYYTEAYPGAEDATKKLLEEKTYTFVAHSVEEAEKFVTDYIADRVDFPFKKSQLESASKALSLLKERMDYYGLSKFSILRAPEKKGALAAFEDFDNSFRISPKLFGDLTKIFETEQKFLKRYGYPYSTMHTSVDDILRSVIDHELGHAIKFRHPEWQGKIMRALESDKGSTRILGYYSSTNLDEYFAEVSETPQTNEYTNIFAGKNIIVIHGESMMTNAINLSFNGVEVTPTLNRLSREGMYFSNFYSQVSVGTSSDTELTYNTSLMPTKSGTAFVSYADRTFITTPKMLKDQGYFTYVMHANNADFWNRRNMYKSIGYDKFYSKVDFKVTKENTIGLGLSDKEFFSQSIPYLKEINEKNQKWYGVYIMLTNHTPFSETEKYGEFPVDIKETITYEDGTTEEVVYPYMEGTKLGNYFKSLHYADQALGEFLAKLDEEGLLENTVFILYGDHDARLPRKDYNRLYNYDKENDSILDEEDPNYKEYDLYQYELGRKVPFIIWTKNMEGTKLNQEVTNVMGMYDVQPTLGNMFGFYNKYALGHDIFNIKDNNVVVFPNGNWVTNKLYYNSQKEAYLSLTEGEITEEEISNNSEYTNRLLDVSNNIIVFNLFNTDNEELVEKEG